ncbi:hypothetical protein Y032_0017g3450 [Ancylostoma ceylanicum]|uniref:Transmembrane protein n=2 Tax=Ancylostoma ceylanicum TaxID=53326 RepID=A0A016V597_9BILA|nr:hypothetical protein Y032_0017g3450 [Ancylostoma ceylanicum]
MVSQALAINPNNSTDTHFGWSETDVLFRNSRIFKRHKRFLFRQVLAAGHQIIPLLMRLSIITLLLIVAFFSLCVTGSSTEIRPIDRVLHTDANAVQPIIRQKRKSFFKKIRDGVKKTFKKIRIKKPQREFLKQALSQILIK